MKRNILLLFICFTAFIQALAQEESSSPEKTWNFSIEANNYFFPGEYILLPVFRADKNKLHLEARYNYEDLETFSGWVGYNFSGGNKVTFMLTPMLGGVVGNSNGLAIGMEATVGFNAFEFYTEMENLVDFNTKDNNFFYAWTDFSYSPTDWLWLGLSGQRTRLYQTDLDIQKGLFVGAGLKNWELTTYVYNLGFDDPFLLVTIGVEF
jgi:hypothetical protein